MLKAVGGGGTRIASPKCSNFLLWKMVINDDGRGVKMHFFDVQGGWILKKKNIVYNVYCILSPPPNDSATPT